MSDPVQSGGTGFQSESSERYEGTADERGTDWDDIKDCWKGYQTETPEFDYTGVQEQGGGENPITGISQAWKKGILNLVWEKELSKKEISTPDNYNGLYKRRPGG